MKSRLGKPSLDLITLNSSFLLAILAVTEKNHLHVN